MFYPAINWNRCTHCGKCIPVCPERIFDFDYDGLMAYTNSRRCIGCNQCEDVCPDNAIEFRGIDD